MADVLIPGLQVAGILGAMGALLGFILAASGKIFYVEVDPRFDLIVENLPGYNCGACGYPGCAGMANGLLAGEANVTGCTPGNAMTYARVKAVLNGEDPDLVEVPVKAKK